MELWCNLVMSYTAAGGVAIALWYARHLPRLWRKAKEDRTRRQHVLELVAAMEKEQAEVIKELEAQVNCAANSKVIAPELL